MRDSKESIEQNVEISTSEAQTKYKEFNTNLLILNWYWIQLISKVSFSISMILMEFLGFLVLDSLFELFGGSYETTKENIIFIVQTVGVKWLFIISICQHLSIGFFCLTNFSNILKETKEKKKFFRSTIIKVILFYFLQVIVMRGIIEQYIFKRINDEVIKLELEEEKEKDVLEVIDDVKKLAIRFTGNLLADFNNNLDKLVFGTVYITLFSTPKCFNEKNILYFRLLSILPLIYVILSLIFRALNNLGAITLSLYVSPIFVGPKFTIFGFFITILIYIKIKEKTYKMYDDEGNLLPNVFAKLSSKIFAIFGFIEFISGLFFTFLSTFGIGGNYLIIVCAPLMILYDYKTKYELHIWPCKNKDSGNCITNFVSIFFNVIVIFLGLAVFGIAEQIVEEKITPLVKFIIKHLKDIIEVLKQLNVFK